MWLHVLCPIIGQGATNGPACAHFLRCKGQGLRAACCRPLRASNVLPRAAGHARAAPAHERAAAEAARLAGGGHFRRARRARRRSREAVRCESLRPCDRIRHVVNVSRYVEKMVPGVFSTSDSHFSVAVLRGSHDPDHRKSPDFGNTTCRNSLVRTAASHPKTRSERVLHRVHIPLGSCLRIRSAPHEVATARPRARRRDCAALLALGGAEAGIRCLLARAAHIRWFLPSRNRVSAHQPNRLRRRGAQHARSGFQGVSPNSHSAGHYPLGVGP